MTNKEWLLNKMQNMSDEELAKSIKLHNFICAQIECPYEDYTCECEKCKATWFKSEHKEKITLSEAERIILENMHEKYKWIARDCNKTICIYIEKPNKGIWTWNNNYCRILDEFNHLFQFIKWEDEEPYNIGELLKEG